MTLDIKKCFVAPFEAFDREELKKNHLIAALITICSFVIMFLGNFLIMPVLLIIMSAGAVLVNFLVAIPLFLLLFVYVFGLVILMFCLPSGYLLETIKRQVDGEKFIMPPWEGNFKRFIKKGTLGICIIFVYTIAITVLIIILTVPIILIGLALKFSGVQFSEELIGGLAVIFTLIINFFLMVVSLVFSFIFPMTFVHYAVKDRFLAGFEIITIFKKIKSSFIDYLAAYGMMILIAIASMFPLMVLNCTCIGMVFMPYLSVFLLPIIYFNLFAQTYKKHDV
jgi:hypothetical protein